MTNKNKFKPLKDKKLGIVSGGNTYQWICEHETDLCFILDIDLDDYIDNKVEEMLYRF